MRTATTLLFYFLQVIARWAKPKGYQAVVAENLLLKQQLLIHQRTRKRAPSLTPLDRGLLGFWSLFLGPRRLTQAAIIIKPATLLKFHRLMKQRKYRLMFSSNKRADLSPALVPQLR